MTDQHTPGPWATEAVKTSIGHAHKISPIKACIYVDHRGVGWTDAKTVEAAANARLIAAAPDHHEAAVEMDRLSLVIESAVRNSDPAFQEAVVAALKANRAAIAKATGGSP